MDLEKLTDRARGFLQAAQTIAVREHHQRITPAHYLKALFDDEQGMAAGLIQAAGGDAAAARREVDALVAKIPSVTGSGATSANAPPTAQLSMPAQGMVDWELPVGSVLIKEFSFGGRRIETRLLVHHDDGDWAGYTYVWDRSQTDAVLATGAVDRDDLVSAGHGSSLRRGWATGRGYNGPSRGCARVAKGNGL